MGCGALWVGRVFLFTLVGFALVGLVSDPRMRWGRRKFWRLSGMYFIPRQRIWPSWRPILTVALLLLLTVMDVRLNVILSLPEQRPVHRIAGTNAAAFLEVHLHLRNLGDNHCARVVTSYIAQAADHLLAAGSIQRMLGDHWVMPRITVAGSSARRSSNPDQRHPARRHLIRGDSAPQLWERCHLLFRWSFLRSFSGSCRVRLRSSGFRSPGDGPPRLHLRHHCDGFCLIGRLIRLNFLNELLTASTATPWCESATTGEHCVPPGRAVENAGLLARFAAVIANTWAIVFGA